MNKPDRLVLTERQLMQLGQRHAKEFILRGDGKGTLSRWQECYRQAHAQIEQAHLSEDDDQDSASVAGAVLRDHQLKEHTRTKRGPEVLADTNAALMRSIMKIDGVELRDIAIGRLGSKAREAGLEAYVCGTLYGMYQHLPHTLTLSEAGAPDEVLLSIVQQGKAMINAEA